jgi:Sap, sulfolipid-1-addressing protein
MQSQLINIFLLSLVAMFNPTLLAAVTVMLLLPSPKALMFGYLLGAYTASITIGLVIVFALPSSSGESTSKHTISPVEDLVVGLLALLIAFVLGTGRDKPLGERRREKKDAKLKAKEEAGKPTQSLPLRMLGKGDPRITFVVGLVLSFPGVSYLDALDHLRKLNPGTVETVLVVVGFCLVQQMFLELPLLGYVFAPQSTADRVTRSKAWMARSGRTAETVSPTSSATSGCAIATPVPQGPWPHPVGMTTGKGPAVVSGAVRVWRGVDG